MGMYNEVFKKCPRCGEKGYLQISQIIFGFGGFDLDDPSTLEELNLSQLQRLFDVVSSKSFQCGGAPGASSGCDFSFTLEQAKHKSSFVEDERAVLLRKLFDL